MKDFQVNESSLSLALFTDVTNSKVLCDASTEEGPRSLLGFHDLTNDYQRLWLGKKLQFLVFLRPTELLDAMQAGRLEPEVALLNASLIPDVFPVLAAAHKALLAKSRESLTTRTFHSELVYNYSGSKHITESLKRCGISDDTTYILAARFGASHDEMKDIEKLISGKEIDLEELEGRANHAQIQKHYKISPQELAISSLADAITCRIAARDAL